MSGRWQKGMDTWKGSFEVEEDNGELAQGNLVKLVPRDWNGKQIVLALWEVA
jgi:hypothetical protein